MASKQLNCKDVLQQVVLWEFCFDFKISDWRFHGFISFIFSISGAPFLEFKASPED